MSLDVNVVARTLWIGAPRTTISVSLASVECGLTAVSTNSLPCKDAEPAKPQNEAGFPTRV